MREAASTHVLEVRPTRSPPRSPRAPVRLRPTSAQPQLNHRTQQANGKVERQIAVIEELLRMNIIVDQHNWLELLPHIMYVLNATFKNSLAGISPMMAEMGIQPLMPIDLHAQLRPKHVEQYKYRNV